MCCLHIISPSMAVRRSHLGILSLHQLTQSSHWVQHSKSIFLCMHKQVTRVVSTCNYHLRQLARIRKNISTHICHAAMQSLIISRLDYCYSNVLLARLPAYRVKRLQKVQDRAARLIARPDPSVSTTTVMKNLHALASSLRENPF